MFGWVKKFLGLSTEEAPTVVSPPAKVPEPIVGKEFPTMVVAPTVDPREVLAADEEWVEPETWSKDRTGKLCRHKRKKVIVQNDSDDDGIDIVSAPMEDALQLPPIPFGDPPVFNSPSTVSPEPDPVPDVPPPPEPSPSYDSSPSYSYDSGPSYDSGSSSCDSSSSSSSCDGGGGGGGD